MSAVLLLIDVQRNMLEGPEPVPEAAKVAPVIEDLLIRGRAEGARIVHVRNNGTDDDPDLPGTAGWKLVHPPREGEHVVDKRQPDAFAETELAELLPEPTTLIMAGMQSDFCVRATALAAVRRGHRVLLVKGAHATYDDPDEKIPAHAVATEVEQELTAAGVRIVAPAEVDYA
ncbi:nicotinamidase-related amidase [Actinoalloteichus hoggarensis]|uniref:Streptothricin hydrolase n=1 Tax=Actinoalloteichus hoggarensis TaxID=1470176 RepID=A0A221W3E4_9PSEU|nr:isochorismatase family protein [Actinoalloteichus hoggarensis]ASO20380.1 Streptothricin hydrolase [Actinoalloteichus hoggarensis]MBB5923418.1 nicotinamidase-related amidase [Actinoalloteichus hoggarensis]